MNGVSTPNPHVLVPLPPISTQLLQPNLAPLRVKERSGQYHAGRRHTVSGVSRGHNLDRTNTQLLKRGAPRQPGPHLLHFNVMREIVATVSVRLGMDNLGVVFQAR